MLTIEQLHAIMPQLPAGEGSDALPVSDRGYRVRDRVAGAHGGVPRTARS